MSKNFTDAAAPNREWLHRPLAERPRGLVRPPQVILDQVAKDKARIGDFFTADYEKLILDDHTLWFYYEGISVAYRSVPEGVEVLAVGADEIGELMRKMSQEELYTIHVTQP